MSKTAAYWDRNRRLNALAAAITQSADGSYVSFSLRYGLAEMVDAAVQARVRRSDPNPFPRFHLLAIGRFLALAASVALFALACLAMYSDDSARPVEPTITAGSTSDPVSFQGAP